jgi:hypothetical protein
MTDVKFNKGQICKTSYDRSFVESEDYTEDEFLE